MPLCHSNFLHYCQIRFTCSINANFQSPMPRISLYLLWARCISLLFIINFNCLTITLSCSIICNKLEEKLHDMKFINTKEGNRCMHITTSCIITYVHTPVCKLTKATHRCCTIFIFNSPPAHYIVFQAYAFFGSRLICNKGILFHVCLWIKWLWVNTHYIRNFYHIHLQKNHWKALKFCLRSRH